LKPPPAPANRAVMSSNIEPLAREMAARICRREGMPEPEIARWVDLHWPCAAAMLEAGLMNERGEWLEGKDLLRGFEAYRERLEGLPK
jgi:hypothetical protein